MESKHKQAFQELRQWCEKYQATISRHPEYDEVCFDFTELVNDQPIIIEYCAYMEFSARENSIIKTKESLSNDIIFDFMEQEDDTEK